MSQPETETVGRFTVFQVVAERGPFRDALARDAEDVVWSVTTWPDRSGRVTEGDLGVAFDALSRLGDEEPDARTELIVDGFGDVVGVARPRSEGWSIAAHVGRAGPMEPSDVLWLTTGLLESLGLPGPGRQKSSTVASPQLRSSCSRIRGGCGSRASRG